MLFIGIALFLLGLFLAFFFNSPFWYSPFVIGGTILFNNLNIKKNHFSLFKNKNKFLFVWFLFVLLGVVVELVGNYWLDGWNYPFYDKFNYFIHVLLIGYPLVGLFGLSFFVWVKTILHFWLLTLPTVALVFGYINEYPNVFAYEWRYNDMILGEFLGIPILISLLWVLLLLTLPFKRLLSSEVGHR